MSTIFLDPVAMDATAAAIADHGREVESLAATLEAACTAEVPAHLAAWLAEELRDIAVVSRLAAVLYQVAAIDTAMRAQQIRIDQSLVTALPGLATPAGVATMGDLSAALGGSTVVGGTWSTDIVRIDPGPLVVGTSTPVLVGTTPPDQGVQLVHPGPLVIETMTPVTATVGEPTWEGNPFLQMAIRLQDSNPALAGQALGASSMLSGSDANIVYGILAGPGLTYEHGAYVDRDGDRGGLSRVYPDPYRPGFYEVRT
jgi:hypothetical protein